MNDPYGMPPMDHGFDGVQFGGYGGIPNGGMQGFGGFGGFGGGFGPT